MVIACCGVVGGDVKKAIPLAVAVEYIHNFTLIHDDLMDNDDKRRGMDTIHIKYGMPTAILAGDALFAKAFQIICDIDLPTGKMKNVLRCLSNAVWDLARGQQMDINNEGKMISEDVYIETIRLKTGALISAAATGGAIIGGANEINTRAIGEYALDLGIGFQMFDDYLGVAGDSSKTGKPVGNDIRKGKCTCMITHAIKSIRDQNTLYEFKSIVGNTSATDKQCARARIIMEESGSIKYALDLARLKINNAISKICILPESEYKDFMISLANYAISRDL